MGSGAVPRKFIETLWGIAFGLVPRLSGVCRPQRHIYAEQFLASRQLLLAVEVGQQSLGFRDVVTRRGHKLTCHW